MDVVDRHRAGLPTCQRLGRLLGGMATPPALLLALTTLLVSGNTLTVAGPTSFGSSDGGQHYTDQWAVKINGSEVDARRLADRHGFVYVDKVGISKFVANIKNCSLFGLFRSAHVYKIASPSSVPLICSSKITETV